jgi:hypothetical protein
MVAGSEVKEGGAAYGALTAKPAQVGGMSGMAT